MNAPPRRGDRKNKATEALIKPNRCGYRSLKVTKHHLVFICLFFLLLAACAVGGRHTSDSKLEENLSLHRTEFETLIAEVSADNMLEMVRVDVVRYGGRTFSDHGDLSGLEHLGLTRGHWEGYKRQLRELGITQLTKLPSGVELRVDVGSFANGDSYKGYEYFLTPPRGHRRASLDDYQKSSDDKDEFGNYCVYKPIKDRWYLFLFVNGA